MSRVDPARCRLRLDCSSDSNAYKDEFKSYTELKLDGGAHAFSAYSSTLLLQERFVVFHRVDPIATSLFIIEGHHNRQGERVVMLHSRFTRYFQGAVIRWISLVLLTATSGAFAQGAPNASVGKAKSRSTIDLSLGIFGQLTPTYTSTDVSSVKDVESQIITTYDQKIQGTSSSVGILGTLHQSFKPWLGYDVNFGYTRFTEKYSEGIYDTITPPTANIPSSFHLGSIGESTYELTAAYLVQGPRTKRIDTFFQLGGGVLSFLPTQDPSPYWVLFRPTLVFGTGMNYRLSEHWALRAEYRGLFYRNPYYNLAPTDVPMVEFDDVTNEPTISMVYRFGRKR
ncbi:MAG: hypothetical protein ACLGPM_04040 [Acidobacteriota bacterium]